MARQTKTQSERTVKRCSNCGARTWQWDHLLEKWNGPYHFQDCPTLPGNDELIARNLENRMRWEQEDYVPREKGRLVLKAIYTMLAAPSQEVMLARKAAILAELKKVEAA